MKYQYQIVGSQQYEYIMGEGEFDSPDAAVEAYKALREAYSQKPGLASKEWNKAVDEYCNTGTLLNGTELYHQMSEKQQFFFQELKKHEKRGKSKNNDREAYNGLDPKDL